MCYEEVISGLKTEIKVELRILEPPNLGRAMELAQKLEKQWYLGQNPNPLGNLNHDSRLVTSSRTYGVAVAILGLRPQRLIIGVAIASIGITGARGAEKVR